MTHTAEELRNMANEQRAKREESFERCDTDGFLSQWASGLHAQLYDRQAEITENGKKGRFLGLYEGSRRVAARIIDTRYGSTWLLRTDESMKFGRKFVPCNWGSGKGRIQKALGLSEKHETAPAWAKIEGRGHGLSGSAWVVTYRTGDKWGLDSEVEKEE